MLSDPVAGTSLHTFDGDFSFGLMHLPFDPTFVKKVLHGAVRRVQVIFPEGISRRWKLMVT